MIELYKRNASGKPIKWSISNVNNQIIIGHGLVGKSQLVGTVPTNRNIEDEIKSLIKAKRNQGYRELKDLYDNAPETLVGDDLYNFLNTYLPKNNLDENNNFIPMLCKTLEDNKPFEKNTYFAEWKINGERCIITAIREDDLFHEIHLNYRSRHGEDWTPKLSYLDEFLIPQIPEFLLNKMIDEEIGLDGELYIPGHTINEINSIIKNVNHKLHYNLQFWLYDICIDDTTAINRYQLLLDNFYNNIPHITNSNDHLNIHNKLILLPIYPNITSFEEAMKHRDDFINLGFEGTVIRSTYGFYQFGGKRNNSMLKFKKIYDGKFKIIDIIPMSIKQPDLGKFILQNDVNEQQFECTINDTHENQRYYLANKDKFIGKNALVEYRERSGITQVPFHAKIVMIII